MKKFFLGQHASNFSKYGEGYNYYKKKFDLMIKLIDEYKAQPETVAWLENNRAPLTDPQQKFTRKVRFRSFLDTSIIKRHLHSLSYLLN